MTTKMVNARKARTQTLPDLIGKRVTSTAYVNKGNHWAIREQTLIIVLDGKTVLRVRPVFTGRMVIEVDEVEVTGRRTQFRPRKAKR